MCILMLVRERFEESEDGMDVDVRESKRDEEVFL